MRDALVEAKEFELWPQHVDAWEVFYRCETQWTVHIVAGAMSGGFVQYDGIPIERVTCIARDWLGITLTRELLDQIRVLEDEAKDIRNRE